MDEMDGIDVVDGMGGRQGMKSGDPNE